MMVITEQIRVMGNPFYLSFSIGCSVGYAIEYFYKKLKKTRDSKIGQMKK